MKLLVILTVAATALAAPQVIPGVFRSASDAPEDRDSTAVGETDPDSDGFPFTFPSFSSIFPRLPDFPNIPDLPDGYDNSTHEITVINGTRYETNTTMTKQDNGNGGVWFTHVHTVRRLPGADEAEDTPLVEDVAPNSPAEEGVDAAENEVQNENEADASQSRSRRWVLKWVENNAVLSPMPLSVPHRLPFTHYSKRHPNAAGTPTDKLGRPVVRGVERDGTVVRGGDEGERHTSDPDVRIPIRNENDIAVNFVGAHPRPANPDAEVFDIDLVRETERRFFEGRSQPIRSQPLTSQPIRSQPLRSQPIRSQPLTSQPIRSQPMRSQPIRSQPMRSQPIRSQPLTSQPIRSQPLTSQPIRSQPMRSQPIRSQPMRSQPIRSQPMRSQPIRSQPLTSQPIRSHRYRSEPRL